MFDVLLTVFATKYLSIAAYGVAVALTLLAAAVPGRGTARNLSVQAVSPFWLVLPALAAAGLLSFGRSGLLAVTADGQTVPVLFVIQVLVSVWVLWRYRTFPWLVFPLALLLGWIQWSFFLAAAARG